jgi:hypothetical protein
MNIREECTEKHVSLKNMESNSSTFLKPSIFDTKNKNLTFEQENNDEGKETS